MTTKAEDNIQFIATSEMPQGEINDITTKVADVSNLPQAKLERFQNIEKLPTSINGIDVSYLAKFVIPYADSYEKFDIWTTAEDIQLL